MAVTRTLADISDAAILTDLQALGTSVAITGFASALITGAPQVTWASSPTANDENMVTAYFQGNNQLRSWS